MQESADKELLRQYAGQNSEAAFGELVRRYINLVYSAAARKTGSLEAAEEITQAVFIILARKAKNLPRETILPGWLYQTTRLTAANFLRNEIRRSRREQEAYMQSQPNETESWSEIEPLLEDAMGRLNKKERDAIVLRFFEGRSFQEIGTAFGGSENAAKKRVIRGLEKLRMFLAKKGVSSTTAIIGEKIFTIQAAPAALAKTVTVVAAAKGATASASTLTLIKGALKLMAWTKTKMAIVGVAVLLAAGTVTVLPAVHRAVLERKIIWKMDLEVLQKEPPIVQIRPAQQIPGVLGGGGHLGGTERTGGKMIGLKNNVWTMLMLAYPNAATEGFHPDRIIVSNELRRQGNDFMKEYDFIACTPAFQKEGLQRALKDKFNVSAHWESRETNVFLLRVRNAGATGLKIDESYHGGLGGFGQGRLYIQGGSLSELADFLENSPLAGALVIDRTELTNSYDIELTWPTKGRDWSLPKRAELDRILLDQLGLELVPGRENVDMLVVEKAR